MIKAYLLFDNPVTKVPSALPGSDITKRILKDSEQDDALYLLFHQLPNFGERIFISSAHLELEVIDIYHLLQVPVDENINSNELHTVKLICKVVPDTDWKPIY